MDLLERLRTDGYLLLRGVIEPPAVEAVRAFLAARIEASFGRLPWFAAVPAAERGPAVARFLESPEAADISRDDQIVMTGHFPLDVRLARELWAIPRSPGLRGVLEEVLGSCRLFMHMPPTARFILPGNRGAGVPDHQDIAYNRHMTDFVTCWVPLVPVDAACGGVRVYRGSGASPELAAPESGKPWLEAVDAKGYPPVDCVPMAPGDILIFGPRLIHGSMPNVSDRTRLSIDLRFFGERDRSTKHHLDMQGWEVIPPPAAA